MTIIGESPRAGYQTQQRTLKQLMQKKLQTYLRQRTMSRLAGTTRGTSRVRGSGGARRVFGPGAQLGGKLGISGRRDEGMGRGFADVNTAPLPSALPQDTLDGQQFAPLAGPASSLGAPDEAEVAAALQRSEALAGQSAYSQPGVQDTVSGGVPGGGDAATLGAAPGADFSGVPSPSGSFGGLVPLGGGMYLDLATGQIMGMGGGTGRTGTGTLNTRPL